MLAHHLQWVPIRKLRRGISFVLRLLNPLLPFLLQFLNTSMVPVTTVVTFTDMTDWPEPPRGQPQMHWKLPFDIFFPFKVALDVERTYRGDLPGFLLLILIMSSIFFFWNRWSLYLKCGEWIDIFRIWSRWWTLVIRFLYHFCDICVPSVLGLSHMDCLSSHVPILCMWTLCEYHCSDTLEKCRDPGTLH